MKIFKMKRILRNTISIMAAVLYCTITITPASASGVEGADNVDFWLNNSQITDAIIMNPSEIARYNQEMVTKLPTNVYDFKRFPLTVGGKDLQKFLQENDFPDGYVNGQSMTADFKQQTLSMLDLAAIEQTNPVRWGLAVRRSSLRLYPTAEGIFASPNDHDFDLLQATIVNPGETLAIMHQSLDGQWLFVQCNNYRGWISVNDVAETSHEEWLKWNNPAEFLVVTAANITISADAENLLLEMGSRLPVVGRQGDNYIVKIPQRQADGQVYAVNRTIAADGQVNLGDLPYTRPNIIRQAFKFYGQPYGWGGLKNSVDCSSFIMDIYRCFGFMMPRDADTQEVAVGKVSTVDASNVAAVLDTTLPGATLHMDGHVMLYLGRSAGGYYVINSLGSHGDSNNVASNGLLARVPVMRVVTTDIRHTLLRSGKTFMSNLRTIKEWQY